MHIRPPLSFTELLPLIEQQKMLVLGKLIFEKNIPKKIIFESIIKQLYSKFLDQEKIVRMSLVDHKNNVLGCIMVEKSEFDSKIFNIDVGKTILVLFNHKIDLEMRRRLIRRTFYESDSDLIVSRISLHDINTIQALELEGAILTDVLITFYKNLAINTNYDKPKGIMERHPDVIVTLASKEHYDQIINIAENEFGMGHFFSDPHIPRDRVKNIYSEWMKNNLNNPDVINIIAEIKNKIVGFISSRIIRVSREYSYAVIDLVAVKEEYRNRGIGLLLVDYLLDIVKKYTSSIYVGTQANNVPAILLYEKLGFKPVYVETTLHKWQTPSVMNQDNVLSE